MSFDLFRFLPAEIRILIIRECDLETILSYFQTGKWVREEMWNNEWFWELKTRRDFCCLIEISFLEDADFQLKSSICHITDRFYKKINTGLPEYLFSNWKINYFHHRLLAHIEFINFASKNDLRGVQEYLREGMDPNFKTSLHRDYNCGRVTALIEASDKGNTDIIRFLLENGADPNTRNDLGNTALALASASCKSCDVAPEILLKARADPNIQNNAGWTPLMVASSRGYVGGVETLLKYGADPRIMNNCRRTASEIAGYQNQRGFAKRRKYGEVINILEKK